MIRESLGEGFPDHDSHHEEAMDVSLSPKFFI